MGAQGDAGGGREAVRPKLRHWRRRRHLRHAGVNGADYNIKIFNSDGSEPEVRDGRKCFN